jgi:hypothetical protein
MLSSLGVDIAFLNHGYSDEAALHVSGKVNKHNCQIWGSENPHMEYECGTPELNV